MRDAEHPSVAARNEYVDQRCAPRERASIEAHLAACEACVREVEALRALRTILATERDRVAERDSAFEDRLLQALDREDAPRIDPSAARAPRRMRGVLAGVAAAAVLAMLWLVWGADLPARDLATAALADAAAARSGRLEVALATSDPARLIRFHREHGISFEARVLDLDMMGWTLAGGGVGSLAGRPSALALYRDAKGRWLVCQMLEGDLADLPAPAQRFEASGFTFDVHRSGNATTVFWREGNVLCVLVSDLPEEEVRALAVAKAMLPG